ncbi:hypothetical protein BDY24DRAFT_373882 [Mrakia frigida]|uniref:uncharacterized protein n=1 Tax=Mrakia frigida TaxID=29902 RepID=UPI003FCBFE78
MLLLRRVLRLLLLLLLISWLKRRRSHLLLLSSSSLNLLLGHGSPDHLRSLLLWLTFLYELLLLLLLIWMLSGQVGSLSGLSVRERWIRGGGGIHGRRRREFLELMLRGIRRLGNNRHPNAKLSRVEGGRRGRKRARREGKERNEVAKEPRTTTTTESEGVPLGYRGRAVARRRRKG